MGPQYLYIFPTLGDFLAGRPDVAIQAFGDPRTTMATLPVGFWIQDHWQIAPGLSLDVGLRYDRQWLPSPFPETNRNAAPRLGLAWHPRGRSNWVLRAGAGLFYDRYPLAYLNDAVQKDGVHAFEQYLTGGLAAEAFALAQGGTMTAPQVGAGRSVYRPAPGFLSTYSRKMTVGIERKIDRDTTATAEFSDVRGIHLPRTRNAALTLPPQWDLEQTAESLHRGMSVTLNRRMSKEVSYLVSYNLSRTEDDASDYDEQPFDPRNLRADWAPSRQHQKHRVVVSGVFDLPNQDLHAPGSRFFKEALDRVTLAPVFSWGTGRPLNVLLTTDVYRTGAYPISARPAGVPRNSAFAPGTTALDLRLMKTIPVHHERAIVQFGAEAFNLVNHTNRLRVSPYDTATLGALVEAQSARQVQLMFQFEY